MFVCFSLELNSEVFNTNKRLKNLFHHRTLFHWKARGVGWYLRVGLCFLEAKNRIPPKKLTTSGTNRFDKDTYCKRKSTMNTLTFLHKSFPTGLLNDDEKRSASDNGETTVDNIPSEQAPVGRVSPRLNGPRRNWMRVRWPRRGWGLSSPYSRIREPVHAKNSSATLMHHYPSDG